MFYYNPNSSFVFNVFAHIMVALGAGVVFLVVSRVSWLLFNKVFKNR